MKSFVTRSFWTLGCFSALTLAACGGGGGDDTIDPGAVPDAEQDTGGIVPSGDGTTPGDDSSSDTSQDTATSGDTGGTSQDTGGTSQDAAGDTQQDSSVTTDDTGGSTDDAAADSTQDTGGSTDSGSVQPETSVAQDSAPSCTSVCAVGTTTCAGAQIRSCALQSNGCYDYNAAADCPTGRTCQGNVCVDAPCTAGEKRCSGNLVQSCNGSGQWTTDQVCSQSCDVATKACAVATTCAPNSRRCAGNQTQVCNSTGTAYLGTETCLAGCTDGLCTGACAPNEKRCNGNVPETCNASGTAYTAAAVCTTYCRAGECAEADLVVNADANRTLDGSHTYAGDVVIHNTSTLKANSGVLIIRAKNFTLAAQSSIVIEPTGTNPAGKGGDSSSGTCTDGCGYSGTASYNASGGGNGTTGVQTSGSYMRYSYCSPACVRTNPGGTAFAIADNEAAAGSPGGACGSTAGAKGGGLLVIEAENITIDGTISAVGQNATGCNGGGSGGMVVLRATNNLTINGSILTTGGSSASGGAGGNGTIKALYGKTRTLPSLSDTTKVIGRVFSSFLPPQDITSSTHPRQELWYNDAFPAFELAWSKPFETGAGYYDKLNTTYGFVPGPSNADYQSTEAILFTPAASTLTNGTYHFHVATLGPAATLGTVENRYTVNINPTPPAVSSSSHPSPSTWYSNSSPYLLWTLPKPDSSTSNFYWVFDRFTDTMPTKADNKIPLDRTDPDSSKRILLPGNANGIWFFHLISEDTMGYLTKTATHFRVQIGAEPAKGGVTGTVTNSTTGAIVSDVTVTLNRGVYTATTNSSGVYTLLNNTVYAQSYEIRARKTGFRDTVKTITVAGGSVLTENIALTPQ